MPHPAFEVHTLNGEGRLKAELIAKAFNSLWIELAALVPAAREMAVVTTKLEEACFFAKKGMANDKENQK